MKLNFTDNFVSKDIDKMNDFYKNILCMDSIPIENFPEQKKQPIVDIVEK